MIDTRLVRAISLFSVLLLSACAAGQRIPEDSFYRLESTPPAVVQTSPALPGMLLVQGGTAAPIYRDRALLYSEAGSPEKLQRYHYQYWVDSPPLLLQRGLADYLRQSGVATQVLLPEDGVNPTYRLRIDIERFEHLRGPDGGVVAVALRVILAERATGALRLQAQFQREAAVQGEDFSAVTSAYQQVLAALYGQILTRLLIGSE